MQFLRTLMWVLLAGLVVAFSFNNWVNVPVRLWGGLIADINLPLLLAIAFALGFLPMLLYHMATGWRLKSRLTQTERTLADLRQLHAAPAEPPSIPPVPLDPATAIPTTVTAEPDPVAHPTLPLEPAADKRP
jgi:lipopolysaccharide assembly protein A